MAHLQGNRTLAVSLPQHVGPPYPSSSDDYIAAIDACIASHLAVVQSNLDRRVIGEGRARDAASMIQFHGVSEELSDMQQRLDASDCQTRDVIRRGCDLNQEALDEVKKSSGVLTEMRNEMVTRQQWEEYRRDTDAKLDSILSRVTEDRAEILASIQSLRSDVSATSESAKLATKANSQQCEPEQFTLPVQVMPLLTLLMKELIAKAGSGSDLASLCTTCRSQVCIDPVAVQGHGPKHDSYPNSLCNSPISRSSSPPVLHGRMEPQLCASGYASKPQSPPAVPFAHSEGACSLCNRNASITSSGMQTLPCHERPLPVSSAQSRCESTLIVSDQLRPADWQDEDDSESSLSSHSTTPGGTIDDLRRFLLSLDIPSYHDGEIRNTRSVQSSLSSSPGSPQSHVEQAIPGSSDDRIPLFSRHSSAGSSQTALTDTTREYQNSGVDKAPDEPADSPPQVAPERIQSTPSTLSPLPDDTADEEPIVAGDELPDTSPTSAAQSSVEPLIPADTACISSVTIPAVTGMITSSTLLPHSNVQETERQLPYPPPIIGEDEDPLLWSEEIDLGHFTADGANEGHQELERPLMLSEDRATENAYQGLVPPSESQIPQPLETFEHILDESSTEALGPLTAADNRASSARVGANDVLRATPEPEISPQHLSEKFERSMSVLSDLTELSNLTEPSEDDGVSSAAVVDKAQTVSDSLAETPDRTDSGPLKRRLATGSAHQRYARPSKRRKTDGSLTTRLLHQAETASAPLPARRKKKSGRSRIRYRSIRRGGHTEERSTIGDVGGQYGTWKVLVGYAGPYIWPRKDITEQGLDSIQCDKCSSWYHYGCVGVKPGDKCLREGTEYACPPCKQSYSITKTYRTLDDVPGDSGGLCGRLDCSVASFLPDKFVGRRPMTDSPSELAYLVKWKGYGKEDSTWQPLPQLEQDLRSEFTSKLVKKFERKAKREGLPVGNKLAVLTLKEFAAQDLPFGC